MNSLEETKSVKLRDGREILLIDDDDISISIIANGQTESVSAVSYPRSGYAGGALHLSPSESYLLFTYYSGQSEEAFMLFNIRNELEIMYESGYLYGEAASYCFSKDEKLLIQCLPIICSEWWLLWEDLEAEEGEAGNVFFDFGYINTLNIEDNVFSNHTIRIYPMENWKPQEENYDPFLSPEMIGHGALKISMPWGEETIHFPLAEIIILNLGHGHEDITSA